MRPKKLIRHSNHTVYEVNLKAGKNKWTFRKEKVQELPIPELVEAFNDTMEIIKSKLKLGKFYEGADVVAVNFKHTELGTRSIQIIFVKEVDGNPWRIKSPYLRFDNPQEGEKGDRQISDELAALADRAYQQVIGFIKGEYAQGQLPLEADEKKTDEQPELAVV